MSESGQGNVFITGASAGIGAATADLLVRRGYTVYAGVHTTPATPRPGLRPIPIDVTDPESVSAAAELVAGEVGDAGLRAVVNNAGIIVRGPLELVAPAELRRQFEVNTLGPAYVCRSFLPLIRAGQGRIVNISAPTARVPIPFLGPIGASKAALVSLSDALRGELAAWRIPVVVIEPGGTDTQIFAKADQVAAATLAADSGALYSAQLAAVAKVEARQSPGPVDSVAAAVVRAVGARKPKRHYAAGTGVRLFATLAALPDPVRDRAVAGAFGLNAAARKAGAR
ncbi:SDR family NAD(P)-dependent oxidoreductase [Nocardia sp. alder85J]|uniref:SDR family NAD(P)-dependent oxidoreductase n=1 Tax=Nocardia sp. alder85J TaxID=2862949 RepID=UPI001CD68039|nr:SDR family NAD(P)-dependent oxidoreductase [Nocardia sp. alder85J]MCX4093685.1 SDR family NAD(P)-dependent oxidoreductase [Nocardia sp. alder85J]